MKTFRNFREELLEFRQDDTESTTRHLRRFGIPDLADLIDGVKKGVGSSIQKAEKFLSELPKIKEATGISDKSKTQLYDVALRIRNAIPKNQTLKNVNQGPKKVDLKAQRPTTKLVGKAEQNVRDTKKENKYNDIFSRLRTT